MALTEQDRINAQIAGRLRALTFAASCALDEGTRGTIRKSDPATCDTFSDTGLDTEEERSLYAEGFNQTMTTIAGQSL